jgi:hypothetical protein
MTAPRPLLMLNAVLLAALALLGGAWAVGSHPSSSPDDSFHLASTWCSWGREASRCEAAEPAGGGRFVQVPPLAEVISQCTNRRPERSAACIADDTGAATRYPSYANAGAYPGGYYAVGRLLVGPETVRSILLLRVFWFVVSAGLIVGVGLLLPPQDRWRAWWTLLALSVPLGLFLFASNNPSGPMIAGCVAVAGGAYAIGRQQSRRAVVGGTVLALLGLLAAAQSRPDGWQFAGLCFGLGALASLSSIRAAFEPTRLLPWAVVAAAAAAAGLASAKPPTLNFTPGQGAENADRTSEFANLLEIPGFSTEGLPAGATFPPTLLGNLQELPRFYIGEFATNLGSFDTPMPAITWALMAMVIGGIAVLGLTELTRFRAAALVLALGALVAVPLYMLQSLGAPVGFWVQPRYLLPLVLTTGLLLAVRPGRAAVPPVVPIVVLSGLLVVAHTWALHRRIRRSVTGIDEEGFSLSAGAQWWWQTSWGPDAVWLMGSLAFAALVGGLAWRVVRGARPGGEQPAGAPLLPPATR